MIVTQLLESSRKPLQAKPAYVKPKHKTYRELLQLDKPKAKLFVESDNEGDDILQKLLKQQKEEKKKKKKQKGQPKSIKSRNESIKDMIQSNVPSQQQVIEKQQIKEKEKEEELRQNKDNPETENKEMMKTLKRIRRHSSKKSVGLKTGNNEIMIDQTDETQFIVNNYLKNSSSKVKSQKCFTTLKSQVKKEPISINSKLDNKLISHKLQTKQEKKEEKDERGDWLKRLINYDSEISYVREKRIRNKEALFKSQMEEQRFLNHLQTYRKKSRLSI